MASIFTRAATQLSRLGLWGMPPIPSIKPYLEQGSGGTAVWSGFLQVKELNAKWIGRQRYVTASDIAVNTSVVAAGIHYFLNLISNPKWRAQPTDPKSIESVELAAFVDNVLSDTIIPWSAIVRQAGMYRFHGFSVQEWIAKKRDDGKIGIENIEVRPQHTIEQWAIDDRGTILGIFQRNPQTGQLLGLPRAKVVYLVEDTLTDSPEGIGVLRHLAEPHERLKRFLELETRAYERDLRGIPVGRAPLTAINEAVKANAMTPAQAQALIDGMKDIIQLQVKQSDTGILMDSATYLSTTAGGPTVSDVFQWNLQLLNGPGLGLAEIASAIERVQREMARVIGVEHLIGDSAGGKAVAQDRSRNIYLIASSVLRMIVASVQNDLIRPLWNLNGFDDRLMPRLMAEDISPRDVVEVGTTLARIAQAGAPLGPNDPVINDVRDMLGVSRAPLIEETPTVMTADPMVTDGTIPLDEHGKPLGVGGDGQQDENPKINPELQRLPRNTAVGNDGASGD